MARFKQSDFKIHSDAAKAGDVRIIKLDVPAAPKVERYSLETLQRPGHGDYEESKKKFGAMAATDPERESKGQKDRRFVLAPLVRGHLAVEEEERRAIEERVRVRVEALSDEARGEAAAVGYQDGLERGYQEAFKKFRAEAADRIAAFDQLLSESENAKREIFEANERFLMELIFRISRMVLLRELKTDEKFLLRLARELIERVGVKENLTVRINPEDATTAVMLKEELEKSFSTLSNLTVEASNQVKRGGCVVVTEWNAIDASIQEQLERVYSALLGQEHHSTSTAAGETA